MPTLRRIVTAAAITIALLAGLTGTAQASTCIGIKSGYQPFAYQLSDFSVNDPTWPVSLHVPFGWPTVPPGVPGDIPSLPGWWGTTYFGPTYIGWIHIGYANGAHYLGGPYILVMVSSELGYIGTAYSGTCPVP